jgi:hypothetical protein
VRDIVLSFGTDEWATSKTPHEDYLAEMKGRRAALGSLKLDDSRLRDLQLECDQLLGAEIEHPTWAE